MLNKKNLSITTILIFVFGTIVFTASCDDNITDVDSAEIPDKNINYYEYIQPVFNATCSFSGCHDDNTIAGGISLTNYQKATADVLVVFPYSPDNSKLVWAIENMSGSVSMPPEDYPGLTNDQIRGIRTWIAEGALVSASDSND